MNKYVPVIGLEIHVQLKTRSKVFCTCSTKFGAPPNTQTCPVCLGLPGVLPVLNRKAFRYAIKTALALNCQITNSVRFDRKNYYYPDLPKNYQISQYALPVGIRGYLEIENEGEIKRVRIRRVHLEEDAGKLIHSEDGRFSFVDYNRAGTPLLEIVTEPDINSPQEAYVFLQELRTTLLYLEVSDCNMEEGSLRCDANISLKRKGEEQLGTKTELKNMNTFKGVRQALEYEAHRQLMLLEDGKAVLPETRLWDPGKQATYSMRGKEEVEDYRYFPDPDLVDYEISEELIQELRREIPELPLYRKRRIKEQYELPDRDVEVLIRDKHLADYFEQAMKYYDRPKFLCNFLITDILGAVNELKSNIQDVKLHPNNCAKLLTMIDKGLISIKIAKQIIKDLIISDVDPETYINQKGLVQISETSQLEKIVEKVIGDNPSAVEDYRKGKEKVIGFLVGEVMKLTRGKANPGLVNEILRDKIKQEVQDEKIN
ncbi:MAG: glutaminyl-tRNA synthase (glutamine-hydrolyzing) subunit B [Candidatus Omnitrophica bacterium 4484_49]|nr:MAG: glutaminyl-tRNA synthase (glutamine-hydrolyzing) subunit B [Candidatus Omnitrophica bacterium 4484_49]